MIFTIWLMLPAAYIFCQNCLVSHTHIIKNLKDLRIKMILMEVAAKDDHFFVFIKRAAISPL